MEGQSTVTSRKNKATLYKLYLICRVDLLGLYCYECG